MNSTSSAFSPTISLPASMDSAGRLSAYLEQMAQHSALAPSEAKRLRLAVEESVANIIKHSLAHTITLRTAVTAERITITIDDDGLPFDPTQDSYTDLSLSPEQRPPGGMGIILLQKMTDEQDYSYVNGHNILTLIKNI